MVTLARCMVRAPIGYQQTMVASAWFMIGFIVLFAIALMCAVVLGARRDNRVEDDVRREARRRMRLRPDRGRRSTER